MTTLSKNQLKNLAAYRLQKNCDSDNLFVVEGVRMCEEALLSGFQVITICGTSEWLKENASRIPEGAECYEVGAEQLERLSNQRTPNKVWMLMERSQPSAHNSNLILALDGLQDPGNMGTILRTADWFGVREIICSCDTVSCYNPKVVQSTMGAIFRTRITYWDLEEQLLKLEKEGFALYSAMLDGESLYEARLSKPAVLVVGNEGRGVSPSVAALVSHKLTIPNIGRTCESLNAAVATGILVNEFCKGSSTFEKS